MRKGEVLIILLCFLFLLNFATDGALLKFVEKSIFQIQLELLTFFQKKGPLSIPHSTIPLYDLKKYQAMQKNCGCQGVPNTHLPLCRCAKKCENNGRCSFQPPLDCKCHDPSSADRKWQDQSPINNIVVSCGAPAAHEKDKNCGCRSTFDRPSCAPCKNKTKVSIDDDRSVIWGCWKYIIGCLPGQIDRYKIDCGRINLNSRETIYHQLGKIISLSLQGENHLLMIDNRSNEILAKIDPASGDLYF